MAGRCSSAEPSRDGRSRTTRRGLLVRCVAGWRRTVASRACPGRVRHALVRELERLSPAFGQCVRHCAARSASRASLGECAPRGVCFSSPRHGWCRVGRGVLLGMACRCDGPRRSAPLHVARAWRPRRFVCQRPPRPEGAVAVRLGGSRLHGPMRTRACGGGFGSSRVPFTAALCASLVRCKIR